MKKRKRGLGVTYIKCDINENCNECGVSYDRFRGGWTYGETEQYLWYQHGRKPSQTRVQSAMARTKREAYEEHKRRCLRRDKIPTTPHDPRDFMDNTDAGLRGRRMKKTRRKKRGLGAPQCGPVTFRNKRRVGLVVDGKTYTDNEVYLIQGYMNPNGPLRFTEDEIIAQAALELGEEEEDGLASVAFAKVFNPGCGIGTKLYEYMQDLACKHRLRLASDTERTRFSEGFWTKQVRKGRAQCRPMKHRSRGATRLNDDMKDSGGYWDCYQYEMKNVCPTDRSLAGRRKKRRAKK